MGTSRRAFLAASAAVAAGAIAPVGAPEVAARPRRRAAAQPEILPRSAWGGDLAPRGELLEEAPGDVRFLLVHHTETPNDDAPDEIPGRLRSIFGYHTGTKGWPDVAYNFFVDAQGRIWEGRTGSIARPVRGDATGGSQGHALLCCFIGQHTTTPPTDAAVDAMGRLTGWLASTYAIDLDAGPTITFTSRGSNRWPAGTVVTTDPIAGHRDMSQTACPGDAAYPLVRGAILERARAAAGVATTTTTGATTTAPTTTVASTTAPTTTAAATSTSEAPPTSALPDAAEPAASSTGEGADDGPPIGLLAAGAAAIAGGTGAVIARRRRQRGQAPEPEPDPTTDDGG